MTTAAKCSTCGTVWQNIKQIGNATREEHFKQMQHYPELVEGKLEDPSDPDSFEES